MIKFTVLLLVVAACISSSVALQCFVCDSTKGDNCIDDNSLTSYQVCPEPTPDKISKVIGGDCLKSSYRVNDKGIKHVKRSCGTFSTLIEFCFGDDGPGLVLEECSLCLTDLCNGSSKVGLTNMWMTLIQAIVTIAIITTF